MKKIGFIVGDLPFVCHFPENIDIEDLLPSFIPFLDLEERTGWAFQVKSTEDMLKVDDWDLLEDFCNDLGRVRLYRSKESYIVELEYGTKDSKHWMWMDATISEVKIKVNWKDSSASQALTSMLRIAYSQRILYYDGFSIHASAVMKDGKGFLFLGKSGTGKSTHSRLWMENMERVELLNDDNPMVRIIGGKAWIYGSPWSGKTPCYKQKSISLAGIVRLQQASENRWVQMDGVKAWAIIYPSCAVIYQDKTLYTHLQNTLNRLVSLVKIAHLSCLPNAEAALMNENKMNQ